GSHAGLGEVESRLAVLVAYQESAGHGPPSGTLEGGAVRREPEVILFGSRLLARRERGVPLTGPGPGGRGGIAVTQPRQVREHDVELSPGAGCQRGVGARGELVQAEYSLPDRLLQQTDDVFPISVGHPELPWGHA